MTNKERKKIELDWDVIYQTIIKEKCVLCIGPDLYTNKQNEKLERQIANFLEVPDNIDIQSFYSKDGLFHFSTQEGRTRTYYKLQNFFSSKFPETESIFNKISLIPFNLIITLTPDHCLREAFLRQDLHCQPPSFYWKNRKTTRKIRTPRKEAPLIYQIFGDIAESDSLVLTYQDLFDYLGSVLDSQSMPLELKTMLSEADNFIFLGIPFEKWYMQLLLRVLAKYNQKDNFLRYAAGPSKGEEVQIFCEEQFRIIFVNDNAEEFITPLFEEFSKNGTLRQPGKQTTSILTNVKSLIASANVEEAIQKFKYFLDTVGEDGEELYETLIILESRKSRLKKRILRHDIDERDADVRQNKINSDLLELLEKARNFE